MIRLMTVWETTSMASLSFWSSFEVRSRSGAIDDPALRHQARGDDVVVHRHLEAAFLGQDELEEIEDVPRVQRRRVGADARGEVGLADDRHAVGNDGLVGD